MLARRGVIADQLTDSQVQEVIDSSSNANETLQSQPSDQHPEPSKPSDIFSPSAMEAASTKPHLYHQRAQDHHHHNHHEWDSCPGITSEAEVLRQMQQMQREQEQWEQGKGYEGSHEYGGINRPKPPKQVVAALEGQVESPIIFREAQPEEIKDKRKQRESSREQEGGTSTKEGNTEANYVAEGGQGHSKERSSSSASASVGAGGGTEGYDPSDYDRGAHVETSRVGLE
ncbi:hypothetical protein QBC32DRAFT_143958 [Pseudoneurospora amorphoporcata]|uniref:Uncharacterized protein n=1 Tax=Pseudoneurospora amorphoporcata TaxID=241081 RepID=A0AAN6NWM9_9PEZI|nr:hypothetical protein QBC32DRAFT_143958 [Pseudoneurospora amorphoporcata]